MKLFNNNDFTVPADHRGKLKESEKDDKYLDLIRELKKTVEHERDGDRNCNWCAWFTLQRIDNGNEGYGDKRPSKWRPSTRQHY